MKKNPGVLLVGFLAIGFLGAATRERNSGGPAPLQVQTMPRIATVDERYQSYNVEMAEVIGGNFWRPYDAQSLAAVTAQIAAAPVTATGAIPQVGQDTSMFQARAPVDLSNARLRRLAAALLHPVKA